MTTDRFTQFHCHREPTITTSSGSVIVSGASTFVEPTFVL